MAIIVDKVQKRKDIALSCSELLLEKGIKKLTVSEAAKVAGVSKGSIYDYFENKEDIVFEIIRIHIMQYHKEISEQLNNNLSTRQKIFILFGFLLDDHDEIKKHQNIYKEYMSINLGCENENMCTFNDECKNFFREILTKFIKDGINNNELKSESLLLIDGIIAVEKGFLVMSWTENRRINIEFTNFINTLFDLIEIK